MSGLTEYVRSDKLNHIVLPYSYIHVNTKHSNTLNNKRGRATKSYDPNRQALVHYQVQEQNMTLDQAKDHNDIYIIKSDKYNLSDQLLGNDYTFTFHSITLNLPSDVSILFPGRFYCRTETCYLRGILSLQTARLSLSNRS